MLIHRVNRRHVRILAICFISLIAFSACEKDEIKDSLTGKWVTVEKNRIHNDTIHFTSDGKVEDYFVFLQTGYYAADSYYFTYSLIENSVEITWHQPEDWEYSESFEYVIDGKSLTLKGFSNPFSLTNEARTDVHFIKAK